MTRKLFFIFALLLMVRQGAWALSQQDGYYLIGSAQDLKDFAALVNGGSTTVNGKLIAPIDLQGSESNQWTPIGSGTWYNGTFDGQGFTISNLYYHQTVASAGLFGYASGSARIKNIRVVVDIDNTGNGATAASGSTEAGGILGTGVEGTVIINCSVAGSVLSFSNVGGIVGTGSVTIVNCYNEATVKFYSGSGQTGGGIHGFGGSPTLINCYNVGQVINTGSPTSHMGNIAISGTATNCYSLENCCQNGAGAAWSNKAGVGITGTTMTLSEMQAAAFTNTLYSNAHSLRATYPDFDRWMQNPTTGLPILQNTYKPTEGPWTRQGVISGWTGIEGSSTTASWNGLNNSQWDGQIFPCSDDTNGLGTQMAGTSTYYSKQAIYSLYSTTQTVPSYSVMAWKWDFQLNNQYSLFAQLTALYAHTDLNALKNAALNFTVYSNTGTSDATLVGNINAGSTTSTTEHYFWFDNRYGSSDKSQPVYMIQTHIMWAAQSSTAFSTQSVSFKDLGSSYTYYWYKHVTFDANGGTGSMGQLQIENSGTLTANTFTRSGYTFAGWNTKADGSGIPYTNEAVMTATSSDKGLVTLYAQWTKNEVTLTDGVDLSTSGLSSYTGKQCDVIYTRVFAVGKTSTVCLPFAYTKQGTEGSFYEFTSIGKNSSGEYVATMTEPVSTTLAANTPYLFTPLVSSVTFTGTIAEVPTTFTAGETVQTDWTFKGTFATIEWTTAPKGTYGFSAQSVSEQGISQGQFVKVGEYVRIKPMRCYLKYTGEDANWAGARGMTRAATTDEELPETISVRLVSANGNLNAIGTLHTETGEVTLDGWYTLDGTKLSCKPTAKGVYINSGRKVVIK